MAERGCIARPMTAGNQRHMLLSTVARNLMYS
eukprot:CAMPEP_0198319114 /NCGR_PEP_ID=MMETSP1450-20131203/8328_1 /TAXON_ID=753684 ORGANISM="Madagascaria erythrocladiodes, Strain CCMP3234" /NCGR_SAMPLE_ID=MMETSP1450 /ASSEMBLY_ACC=CAM_ASM_001115 /LENGTH=31 /DNA_ID= /DNA_START= /DNA_END= /DNA_ORIENTATION=